MARDGDVPGHRLPGWPEEEVTTVATAKRRVHPDPFVVYAPEYWANLDWAGLLAQVTCPVLLIQTDLESGGILSAEAAAAFQQLVPQAQIAYIPGATHSIRRDRYREYMAAVERLLRSIAP